MQMAGNHEVVAAGTIVYAFTTGRRGLGRAK